jgi:hypothetical protein
MCIQNGRCILSVVRHTSKAAVFRNFTCSEIEGFRELLQADDQFEDPTAVTNYVTVHVNLTNTTTTRQSTSFLKVKK